MGRLLLKVAEFERGRGEVEGTAGREKTGMGAE